MESHMDDYFDVRMMTSGYAFFIHAQCFALEGQPYHRAVLRDSVTFDNISHDSQDFSDEAHTWPT